MMIHAVHLLWVIPLSAVFGYMCAAICFIAKYADEQMEKQMKHLSQNTPDGM